MVWCKIVHNYSLLNIFQQKPVILLPINLGFSTLTGSAVSRARVMKCDFKYLLGHQQTTTNPIRRLHLQWFRKHGNGFLGHQRL